jgi:hypothetical protein
MGYEFNAETLRRRVLRKTEFTAETLRRRVLRTHLNFVCATATSGLSYISWFFSASPRLSGEIVLRPRFISSLFSAPPRLRVEKVFSKGLL